jgi:small-conductance mechanosensitive channel
VLVVQFLVRRLARYVMRGQQDTRTAFWLRQGTGIVAAVLLVLGFASIWFNDPRRLATALGLLTAALAFSLQRLMAAIAGYFIILRGKTFSVGDRIVMGGVRGDVIALRLTQTTIMEMGQPPSVGDQADPAVWVRSRQYTGRVVTVSNARIFEEPVYNYTREFPYIWEELSIPIPYDADRAKAEAILMSVARRHSTPLEDLSDWIHRYLSRCLLPAH